MFKIIKKNNTNFKCSPMVVEGFDGNSNNGFICSVVNKKKETFENTLSNNVTEQVKKLVMNNTVRNYDQCVQHETINNLAYANKLAGDDGAVNTTRYTMCAPYYKKPGWTGGGNKDDDRKDEFKFPGNVLTTLNKMVVAGEIKNYDQCVQNQTINDLAYANKYFGDDGAVNNTRYAMCAPYYKNPGWSGGANKSDDRKDVYNKLLPAKFVRLEGGSDYINLSQLAVKDLNGVNVSKGKLTKSSGVGWDGPESAAVDGVESARGHPGEYHSNGPNAWFEVDLGTPTQISTVEVYNRADCCQNRMGSGYKIKLLDENRNVFFTSDNLTGELVQTIKVQSRVFPKIDCPNDQTQAGISCYPNSLINKK